MGIRQLFTFGGRRPLAAARAVLFSQLVDDPSGYVDELRNNSKLVRNPSLNSKGASRIGVIRRNYLIKCKPEEVGELIPGTSRH